MRMSDWSSDVCSSDLDPASKQRALLQQARAGGVLSEAEYQAKLAALPPATGTPHAPPRGWILGLAFCVPLLVVVLYVSIGEPERKCGGEGKWVAVSGDIGGSGVISKKTKHKHITHNNI